MLQVCPRCNYSLKGLPAEHTCPECGLVYDAASEVYRISSPWVLVRILVAPLVCVCWLFAQSGHFMRLLPPNWSWVSLLLFLGFLLTVLWISWRVWRNYKRGMMVATMPEALWLRLEKVDEERIPWSEITRIIENRGFVGATMFLTDTKMVRDIRGVFKKRRDAERFVAQATARIAQARATPAD